MKQRSWIEKIEQWPRPFALGCILGLGALLRLLVIVMLPGIGDPNSMDTQSYLHLARSLVQSDSFAMWNKPTAYVAPGYPFFLAAIFKALGENLLAVKLIQVLLSAATTGLVYILALRFMRPAMALLAALLAAVNPELVGITSFIYTETLFMFLLVASLLMLVQTASSQKFSHALLAGGLLGMATLCRGVTFYFPILLLTMVMLSAQRWMWLRRWALFVFGMAVVMAPWTIRNYQQFGVFLPVATGSGDVFWTGNYLEFDGEYRYETTQAKLREVAGDVDLITRDRRLMEDAKNRILAEPLPHAWLFLRKIGRYWLRVYENIPSGEARQRNWLVFGVLAATHYGLLLLTIFGLRQFNRQSDSVKILATFILYYTIVHAATLAVARYRIPLLLLLAITSAAGIIWLYQKSWANRNFPLTVADKRRRLPEKERHGC